MNDNDFEIFEDWDVEEVPQFFFRRWRKKIKRGIKKTAHKINRGVTKTKRKVVVGVKKDLKGIVKVVKKVGGFIVKLSLNAAFLPLLPFKKSMEHLLAKRHIKTKHKGFGYTVLRFVKLLVTNHVEGSGTAGKLSKLLKPSELAALTGAAASTSGTAGIPAGLIATLIPILMNMFKRLKAKEKSGEPLTPTERKMIDLADKSTDALKGAVIESADKKSGEIMRKSVMKFGKFVKKNKLVIGGGIVGVGVAVAVYKKMSKK